MNPPVHAWAAHRVYQIERRMTGKGDFAYLERIFHKLMINFTWWVNRKDREGNNMFQGGFLGLDNIGAFDRSAQMPSGAYVEQSDGTSWMAQYSLSLLMIALDLAIQDPVYEDTAMTRCIQWYIDNRPELPSQIACFHAEGVKERQLLAIVDEKRLKRILKIMLDEKEFLSPYGIRSVSQSHRDNPFRLDIAGPDHVVDYEPGESTLICLVGTQTGAVRSGCP